MCSIQDEENLHPEKSDLLVVGETLCTKCQKPAVIVIRVDHKFCRECFLAYATHKFRSAFGKSRVVRDGEKVLLAFSGGNCSTALLHLCLEGKSPRAPKKLRFKTSIIYIDEGATVGLSAAEREERNHPIMAAMRAAGMQAYMLPLEQALSESVPDVEPASDWLTEQLGLLTVHQSQAQKLRALLDSARSLTARENILNTLRLHLLVSVAAKTGHTKVLLGDSCTRLSVRLLSSITQGRGAHVAHEMAFGDNRLGEVMVLRPLRDFLAKEIVLYNALCGLEATVLPNIVTKASSSASLDRLTESFLNGLQAEFPATVSTVFRTGAKLDPGREDPTADGVRCIMCQSRLDTHVPAASALSATQFSWSLCHPTRSTEHGAGEQSVTGCDGVCDGDAVTAGEAATTSNAVTSSEAVTSCDAAPSRDGCCGEGGGSCHKPDVTRLSVAEITEMLCYGCRLVVRDMKDMNTLPQYMMREAERRTRRTQMKESIKDFLLEDDSG